MAKLTEDQLLMAAMTLLEQTALVPSSLAAECCREVAAALLDLIDGTTDRIEKTDDSHTAS